MDPPSQPPKNEILQHHRRLYFQTTWIQNEQLTASLAAPTTTTADNAILKNSRNIGSWISPTLLSSKYTIGYIHRGWNKPNFSRNIDRAAQAGPKGSTMSTFDSNGHVGTLAGAPRNYVATLTTRDTIKTMKPSTTTTTTM
jgi:hypothetical protein